MKQEKLEAIRKRAEKATEGPWKWDGDFTYKKRGMLEPLIWESDYKGIGVEETDAEFIAHAREDIPALLDEVERLKTELDYEECIGLEDRRYIQNLIDLIAQCKPLICEDNAELTQKITDVIDSASV